MVGVASYRLPITDYQLLIMYLFRKTNNLGFTVLELVIVTGIMALLAAVAIANFRGFERDQVLDSEADKLASVLRQAQIFALTGQTTSDTRYSYGVHLETCLPPATCQYILFSDLDGDNLYDSGEELSGNSYEFIKGTYVSSLDPVSGGNLDIVFEPPEATIYFNNQITDSSATTTLVNSLSGKQRDVIISRESGQINIE